MIPLSRVAGLLCLVAWLVATYFLDQWDLMS